MMTVLSKIADTWVSILHRSLSKAPTWADTLILIGLVVFLTANPYYLNNRINIYELSLYLPGIRAINEGMIPFRDFFYLRGPFELYMPTWLMGIFGEHIDVLCGYFFVGNVLCVIMVVLIARELIRSKYMFFLMIPVITARTFPRVCYMNWGGMRYVFGLLAVLCLIRFFKTKRVFWSVLAGLATAAGAMTSVEIGACAFLAASVSFMAAGIFRLVPLKEIFRAFSCYLLSLAAGVSPWVIYASFQGAFIPYIDTIWTMATRFMVVINPHYTASYPSNIPEAFAAMINPSHDSFKHMTPAYTYLFFMVYMCWRWKQKALNAADIALCAAAVYGAVLYQMAFRALLASQFEMALMPQKIIYFFMIEAVIIWLWVNRTSIAWQKIILVMIVTVLFFSSLSYSISRFNKRFWSLKFTGQLLSGRDVEALKYAGKKEEYALLDIERVRGIWVPKDQALELKALGDFFKAHSKNEDIVLMFPEYGAYNFIFDRPFLGRFAMSDLAWLSDVWFEEYLSAFKDGQARYVVVQKTMPPGWEETYFGYAPNRHKYDLMIETIDRRYRQVAETDESRIYERK